ncbi:MAG TPA: transcription termination factor Rho, partial [Verrucomicrobiales bacterium]|nr:transcription termination factor Rho [Verrucomicrobiales bacterium]
SSGPAETVDRPERTDRPERADRPDSGRENQEPTSAHSPRPDRGEQGQGQSRKRGGRNRRRKGNRDHSDPSQSGQSSQTSPSDRGNESRANREEEPIDADGGDEQEGGDTRNFRTRKQRYLERKENDRLREAAALDASPAIESEGLVEISPKGFGFLRERIRGFQQSPKDVFVTPEIVRIYGLRDGLMVKCVSKQGVRGPQLIEVLSINDRDPAECAKLPYFEELTAINPNKKLTLETESTRATTRVIDLMAPIGRGQRGLIVAPPRTGKTTLLHHIAEGIQHNYDDEIHLMVLLVDERPEEVTDFERSFPNVEVFSSSNDSEAKDHTRIALLAIERAKRLVEGGRHVVMLMDSITRLARAFNSQMRGGNRGTASGGLIVGALEEPRRIFAAARNTREAGSLTIIATALVQTNSKADEAIFQEFKGTGNMELVLDRQIAQNYVYPAVDINKSGTRREELLLPAHVLEKIYVIRRGLSGYKQVDAMEWLLKCMQRYPSNAQMLMDIKTTALS